MKTIIAILLSLVSFISLAQKNSNTYFCSENLGKLPIQQNGRVKPLYVHANENLKFMTGKSKFNGFKSVTAYCLLSLKAYEIPQPIKLQAKIEHIDLKKFFNLKESQHLISFDELLERKQDLRFEIVKQKSPNAYKKALQKAFNKASLYEDMISARNWTLPSDADGVINWVPLLTEINMADMKNLISTPKNIENKILELKKNFDLKNPKHTYNSEYTFSKLKLPRWILILTFIGLLLTVLIRNQIPGLSLAIITVIVQTVYITFRIYISGRAPITNMYETVLFSGYASLILALVIGHFKKEKLFIVVGLCYNLCTAFMINFSGGMLSPSIGPLVPVLRDNFWLSTHVTCIIVSYGALALSWVMANIVLIKSKLNKITNEDLTYYSNLIYTCLKYGTVLLGAGIILGGVWADYSWGRFWGWDPKETWSLIVFCLYIAILHGRYTNWIPKKRFVPLVALAFLSVMMAWFGVNYILATGLHSYGFSEGGAIFLGSFFLIQFIILGWSLIPNSSEAT